MFTKLRSQSTTKVQNTSLKKAELESFLKENSQVKYALKAYGIPNPKKKYKSTRETRHPTAILTSTSPKRQRSPQVEPKLNSIVEQRAKTEKTIQKILKKPNVDDPIHKQILKSKSDILEIKRDLATYEFSVLKTLPVYEAVAELSRLMTQIDNVLSDDRTVALHREVLSGKIKSVCTTEKIMNKEKVGQSVFSEDLGMKIKNQTDTVQKFQGTCVVSGVNCVVSVKTSFFCRHFISCLLTSGQNLQLEIEKDISDYPDKTNPDYKIGVKQRILKFLFINKKTSELKLEFEEASHTSFYIKIMGIESKVTLFVQDLGESFLFHVKNTNLSLVIEKILLEIKELEAENLSKVKKEISKHLFLHKNALVWGEHPFLIREQSSRYFKAGFLSEAFDEDTRKIFSIKVSYKCKIFKIDGFDTKKGKQVKVFYNRAVVTIQEGSHNFFLMFGLQSLNFFKDFKTLEQALEVRILLDHLFSV